MQNAAGLKSSTRPAPPAPAAASTTRSLSDAVQRSRVVLFPCPCHSGELLLSNYRDNVGCPVFHGLLAPILQVNSGGNFPDTEGLDPEHAAPSRSLR